MRAPAVSFVRKIVAAAAVGLLACGLALPHAPAFAEGEGAPSALLASSLMDGSGSVVREDVALAAPEDDAVPEPVIASFTVDGLTFAVRGGSNVQLVGIAAVEADASTVVLPESVTYEGAEYFVTSIGAYAFYLSGVTSVELPASVTDVDDRAFRSSDVASVEVTEGNPSYSSFDGALYDADQLSLLLIPEGKQGTVLLPKTAESAAPSVFSHCPLVTQVAVEEGSAAFASENGLLYTADLTTLLRVPAGATEITIHDGCATIAAGAMEGCVSLERINAPASVTSISPYLFEQQPETVMAPVAVVAFEDDAEGGSADEGELIASAPQLSAMVALSSADDGLPSVDVLAINLLLPVEANTQPWQVAGFIVDNGVGDDTDGNKTLAIIAEDVSLCDGASPTASLQSADVSRGAAGTLTFNANGGLLYLGGLHYSGSIIDMSSYQAKSSLTIYAVGSSFAPAIYLPTSAQEAWFQGSINDTVRFAWWNIAASSTTKAGVNYYADAKRPGYVPTGISGSGTLSPGTAHLDLVSGGVYTITGWTKKPAYSVTLDKNGGSIDRTRYYWPDMGYVSTLSSTTVIQPGSTLISSSLLPTRAGYTFAGYWDTPDATGGTMYIDEQGKLTDDAEPFESAGKLYARWTKNPVYAITLMQNTTNTTAWYTKVYLWYGKGWYGTANPNDDTTPLASLGISPSWAGRTYKGFSADRNASTADYWTDLSTMPSTTAFNSSQSLYAVWEKNPVYKMTINPGSGTGGTSEIYLWYGKGWYSISNPTDSSTAISTIDFPSYPGYSPTGCWSSLTSSNRLQHVDADGTIKAGTEAVTEDSTWYVGWSKRPVYAITLDPNGGTGGTSVVYQWTGRGWYGVASPNDSSTVVSAIVAPERTGYTFKGYATSQNATTAKYWTSLTSFPSNIEFASATKLYAVWAVNTSTVTFDAGAGTLNPSLKPPLSIAYGASSYYTYSYLKATRAGYVFGGWFDANGNQAWDGDGNAVEGIYWSKSGTTWAWHYDGDVKLIAKWYATLTFDANGGTVSMYTGTTLAEDRLVNVQDYQNKESIIIYEVNSGEEPGIYDPSAATQAWLLASQAIAAFWDGSNGNNYGLRFSRPGYTPIGMTGTNPDLTTTSGPTRLVPGGTFQVQWEPKTINITWDSNGGSEVAGTSATYSETGKVPMPASDPFLAGKKFEGWFTAREGGEAVTAETSLPAANTTYYAHWMEPASIVFNAEGGRMSLYTGTVSDEDTLVDLTKYQGMEGSFTIYETGTGGNPAILATGRPKQAWLGGSVILAAWWDDNANNYGLRIERPGYTPIGLTGTDPALTLGSARVNLVTGNSCVAQWRPNHYIVALDANGADAIMPDALDVDYEQGAVLPEASAQGFVFRGWNTKADGTGDPYQPGDACDTLTQTDGATVTLYAQWTEATATFEAGEGGVLELRKGVTASGTEVIEDSLSAYVAHWDTNAATEVNPYGAGWWRTEEGTRYSYSVWPKRPGCALIGWKVTHPDGVESVIDAASGKSTFIIGATYTAMWTPMVSVDVPIEVTAQVDLLGIEDQVPASGYIESRCGAPLAVEEVSFTALAGAADLFGEANTASVSLQALALEGSASWDASAPTFSFPLSADATESDASRLAALRMEGYEDHIPIGYRFAIPEDVLASIDPVRFEQVTTPVCSVVYTVALAS